MRKVFRMDLIVFLIMPIAVISFIVWRMAINQPLTDGKLFLIGIVYIIISAVTSKR